MNYIKLVLFQIRFLFQEDIMRPYSAEKNKKGTNCYYNSWKFVYLTTL